MYAHNKILNLKDIYSEKKVSFSPLFPSPHLWLPVVLVSCTSFQAVSTICFSVVVHCPYCSAFYIFCIRLIYNNEGKQQQQYQLNFIACYYESCTVLSTLHTHTHTHTHTSICSVLLLYQLRKLKPKEINNLLKVLWLIGFGQSLDNWRRPILCNSCIIFYCGDIPHLDVQFLVNEQLS